MSEISLRDYFAKLEQLLTTNAADEVIHHCRHILQYYPKNVSAYRYLGRALLVNGRWDEATAALRRVLSVIPDDFIAHLGLSEVYDHKKKADEAIWHLERAFEQNPNSSQLLDGVRALYRRYRDVEQAKVQLTAAAVARQAQRNHDYEHAIDTLRDALERQPDRIDLRLLLALTLWESSDHVEAAETALDVLQVLPDCLEANRMLTMLWLEEDRPSDAQRYLNRVEAIDPYIAVEVAQGQPASDDAFRLEELDYKRSAQSELTVNRPDWLKDITEEAPQVEQAGQEDWSNFMSSMLASSANQQAQAEEEKPAPDLFSDDWMAGMEKQSSSPSAVEEEEIPAEFATPPSFSESSDDATTLTPNPSTLKASDSEDPMAWLRDSGLELIEEEDEPLRVDQPDTLEWMQEDVLAEDVETSSRPMPDAEAFSWMQSYNVKLEQEIPASDSSLEEAAASQEEMPDWLKDEGFLDEALGIEQLTGNDQSVEPEWLNPPSQKLTADLPVEIPPEIRPTTPIRERSQKGEDLLPDTDWLRDATQDEPQAVPGPRRGLTAMLNEANFEWLQEQKPKDDLTSDVVMDEWLTQFGPSNPPTPPAATEPQWLTELDTDMSDEPNQPNASDEKPKWLSDTGGQDTSVPSSPEEESGWLDSDSEQAAPAEMPDWLAELQPAASTSSPAEVSEQPEDKSNLDWSVSETVVEEAAATEMPDWLAELQPAASSPSTSESGEPGDNADTFDWSVGEVQAEAAEPTDMPDWMADLEPTSTYETPPSVMFEQENAAVEGDFEWLAEDGVIPQKPTGTEESEFTWLDEAAIEPEPAKEQPTATTETPEWLSQLQPQEQEKPEAKVEPVATSSDEFSWLDEVEREPEAEAAEEPPTVTTEIPDWLSDLQPQALEAEGEPVATSEDQSWLNETETKTEAEAIPGNAVEVPDWLSELQPQAPAQPETEPTAAVSDDFTWLDEVEVEPEAEPAEELPTIAAETPEWLSQLQSQAQVQPEAEAEPVAATTDNLSWLDEVEAEPGTEPVEEQPAVAADVPEWLSQLQPQEQETPKTEAEPVAATSDEFSWLDEVEAEPETELVAQVEGLPNAETYSWLEDIESDTLAAETESPVEEAQESIAQPDMEVEALEPVGVPSFALVEDADDEDDYWLNDQEEIETVTGEQPLEDDITEFEGMTVFPSDEMDMMQDENFEPVPASNAPDWLNAMVPGLDVDFEPAEEEPLETEFVSETTTESPAHAHEFDWVEEIVEEESRQPEITTAVAEPLRPRYAFSRPPAWLNEPTKPINHDDELPDWPSDVPDWLR